MKTFFFSAIAAFLLVTGLLQSQPAGVATPVASQTHVEPVALAPLKPIVTEQQQINNTAKVVSKLYGTLSVPQAKDVVKVAFASAKKNNIDPYLIVGLIAAESGFRKHAVSHMGAGGYMQIMEVFHQDKLKGRDVFDTQLNIQIGTKILSNCLKKHRTNKRALGCYNGVRSIKGIQAYYDKVSKKSESIKRLVM